MFVSEAFIHCTNLPPWTHYLAVTHEAYSKCKAPQRDALASPGTFGVDPEKATLGRPWIKATAAMFPVGQITMI